MGLETERNFFASQDLSTVATFEKMDEGCLRALGPSLEVIPVKSVIDTQLGDTVAPGARQFGLRLVSAKLSRHL